tara:strand:+ start:117260 stop:118027 length:768 start_codon:yes stop_codon:yes gene_type:complete
MPNSQNKITAALIIIGNEILSGRTKDANLNYIASQLIRLGIDLYEVRVVRDQESQIIKAINELRESHNYVFTTGGIGPTHDDITCESVSKALGRRYILNADAHAILKDYYDGSDKELNEARLRMAYIPEGAKLIENPISKAPGFIVDNVIVMAGIPAVMQAMFQGVAPLLETGNRIFSKSLSVMAGEGDIAKSLGELQTKWKLVEIGSYPFVKNNNYGTTLVLRTSDLKTLNSAFEDLKAFISPLDVIFEINDDE